MSSLNVILCPFNKKVIWIVHMMSVIHTKVCSVLVHGFGCYYVAGSGEKLKSLCRNPFGKS